MATTLSHCSGQHSDSALKPFVNEPFIDFTNGENKRRMQEALAQVASELGREYDMVIGGSRLQTAGKIVSNNPARPAQVIGVHQRGGTRSMLKWRCRRRRRVSGLEPDGRSTSASRTCCARRTLIRERKFEFCAWLTLRGGQELGRGGCGCGRDHRLPGVLCARGAATGRGDDADPVSRRDEPAALHSAWASAR